MSDSSNGKRKPIEDHDELLYRQVSKSWVVNGRITSQAFNPFPKDNGELSVARGSMATAKESFEVFTVRLGFKSVGTWAVTVGECSFVGLPSTWDPLETPIKYDSHSIIDFTLVNAARQREVKAKQLAARAQERGCQYSVPAESGPTIVSAREQATQSEEIERTVGGQAG